MEKVKKEPKMKWLKDNWIELFCFIIVFVIAYLFHLFGVIESFQQFVVVIISAAATYVIVSLTIQKQSNITFEQQRKLNEMNNEILIKQEEEKAKRQDDLIAYQEMREERLKKMEADYQIKLNETQDEIKRKQELYNAKLGVYSDFVSFMYKILEDGQVEETEMLGLRTKLFGEISFYAKEEVIKEIEKEIELIKDYNDIDVVPRVFAGITSVLQKDLNDKDWPSSKECVLSLWGKFEEIIGNTKNNDDGKQASKSTEPFKESTNETVNDNNQGQQTEELKEQPKRLKQQAWHFIMWGDKQLEKLKEGFTELSLVEYGEYWRTNLVKQVREGDIIMLFRRGGGGYIGAYKAIGRRVFIREDNVVTEEYLKFGEDPIVKAEEYWNGEGIIYEDKETVKHLREFDIYDSILGDGATSCANIIVEPIAFKEGGVGNPGGVYRRTISRYDSLYAGMLMQRFEKAGVIIDGKENDYELYVS